MPDTEVQLEMTASDEVIDWDCTQAQILSSSSIKQEHEFWLCSDMLQLDGLWQFPWAPIQKAC